MPDRSVLIVAATLIAAFLFGSLLLVAGARPGATPQPVAAVTQDRLDRLESRIGDVVTRIERADADSASRHRLLEGRLESLERQIGRLEERGRAGAGAVTIEPGVHGQIFFFDMKGNVRVKQNGSWTTLENRRSIHFNDTTCIAVGPGGQVNWVESGGRSGTLQENHIWQGDRAGGCRPDWSRPPF